MSTEAARRLAYENEIAALPVLLALESEAPDEWRVWCPWCKTWHFHMAGEGPRVAHCREPKKVAQYFIRHLMDLPEAGVVAETEPT